MRGDADEIAFAEGEAPRRFDDEIFASGFLVFPEEDVEPIL